MSAKMSILVTWVTAYTVESSWESWFRESKLVMYSFVWSNAKYKKESTAQNTMTNWISSLMFNSFLMFRISQYAIIKPTISPQLKIMKMRLLVNFSPQLTLVLIGAIAKYSQHRSASYTGTIAYTHGNMKAKIEAMSRGTPILKNRCSTSFSSLHSFNSDRRCFS